MYVWLFQGNLGEGKTFGMTLFATYYASRAKRAGLNVDLFSNFGLKNAKELTHYTDFYKVAKAQNSIVLLDEAHVNLDSRLFHKGSNIYMTQFFFYLRKLRSSLFMTTPSIRNVDSRMRLLTNILVDCHKLPNGFRYDIYDLQAEKLLRRKFLPKFKAEQLFKLGLYDTHSIVRAVQFPSTEREFDNFLNKIEEIQKEKERGLKMGGQDYPERTDQGQNELLEAVGEVL